MEKVKLQNSEILISIIVPIYNDGETLEKCILSILEQSYVNLQVILIDDGSTDSTFEVSEQLSIKDKRIEVYHTENRGSVAARKFGLRVAKGQYIGFIDADDYIEQDMFQNLLEIIISTDADFVHSGHIEEAYENNKIVCNFEDGIIELKDIKLKIAFLSEYVLEENVNRHIVPSLCSKLFRAEFIKKCFSSVPNEQQYGEDLLCLCRCILECQRFVLYRKCMYHYVIKKDSLSHMNPDIHMMKQIGLCHHLLKVLEEYGCMDMLKESIYYFLKRRMIYTALEGDFLKPYISQYYLKQIEKVIGKRIVIFGAGKVGQDYYAQLSKYRKCHIVAWVDSNWNKYNFDYAEVIDVNCIDTLAFDLIIIAVRDEKTGIEMKDYLIKNDLNSERILWQEPGRYF